MGALSLKNVRNNVKSAVAYIKRNFINIDFFIFIFISTNIRFFNFENTLYLIWDQGRDAWKLQQIAHGDFTLIGPTSGLQGFFLGPLWYYIGLPGYWLSNGNSYGINLWYIFLSCMALPIFWMITHRLFSNKKIALTTAYLLAFVPASIEGSLQIWNPLIAVPLMAATLLAAFSVRTSRLALAAVFFFLALTLQSEFAYAIFFLAPLFLAIPWLRKKWSFIDVGIAGISVAITGIPQLLFELRNNWIMTKSLLAAMANNEQSVQWIHLWKIRPLQLFHSTRTLLVGNIPWGTIPVTLVILVILASIIHIWKKKNITEEWKIVSIFALIPYIFFMFWRGNYGNFFSYYLTPHFIFLVLLFMYGLDVFNTLPAKIEKQISAKFFFAAISGIIIYAIWNTLAGRILFIKNDAGLKSMKTSIEQTYLWQKEDAILQGTLRVYTPNAQTEHYDYLVHEYAQQNNVPVPDTVRRENTDVWYLLMEPETQLPKRFTTWYESATNSGILIRSKKLGIHTLETWATEKWAVEKGYLEPSEIKTQNEL